MDGGEADRDLTCGKVGVILQINENVSAVALGISNFRLCSPMVVVRKSCLHHVLDKMYKKKTLSEWKVMNDKTWLLMIVLMF